VCSTSEGKENRYPVRSKITSVQNNDLENASSYDNSEESLGEENNQSEKPVRMTRSQYIPAKNAKSIERYMKGKTSIKKEKDGHIALDYYKPIPY